MRDENELKKDLKLNELLPEILSLIGSQLERRDLAAFFQSNKKVHALKTKPNFEQEIALTKKLLAFDRIFSNNTSKEKSLLQLKEQFYAFGQSIEDEEAKQLFFALFEKKEEEISKDQKTALLLQKQIELKEPWNCDILKSIPLILIASVFNYQSLLHYVWNEAPRDVLDNEAKKVKHLCSAIMCYQPISNLISSLKVDSNYLANLYQAVGTAGVSRNFVALSKIYNFVDVQTFRHNSFNLAVKEQLANAGMKLSFERNDLVIACMVLFYKEINVEQNAAAIIKQISLAQWQVLLEQSYKLENKSYFFLFSVVKHAVSVCKETSSEQKPIKFKLNLAKLFALISLNNEEDRIASHEFIKDVLDFLTENKKYIEFSGIWSAFSYLLESQLYLDEFIKLFDHEITISKENNFGFKFISSALSKSHSNSTDFFEATLKFIHLAKIQGCNALVEKVEEAINWTFRQYSYSLKRYAKNVSVVAYLEKEGKEQIQTEVLSNCSKYRDSKALEILNQIQFYNFYQQIAELNPAKDVNQFFALLKQTSVDFISSTIYRISLKLKAQKFNLDFITKGTTKKIEALKALNANFEEFITEFDFNKNPKPLHQVLFNVVTEQAGCDELVPELNQLYFFIKSLEPEIKKYCQMSVNANMNDSADMGKREIKLGWAQTH